MKRWRILILILLFSLSLSPALAEGTSSLTADAAVTRAQEAWKLAGAEGEATWVWAANALENGGFSVTAQEAGETRLETRLGPDSRILLMKDHTVNLEAAGEKAREVADDDVRAEELAIWLLDFADSINPGAANAIEAMGNHSEKRAEGRHILTYDGYTAGDQCTRFVIQLEPEKRVLSYEEEVPYFFCAGLDFEPISRAKELLKQAGIFTDYPCWWCSDSYGDEYFHVGAGWNTEVGLLSATLDRQGNAIELLDHYEASKDVTPVTHEIPEQVTDLLMYRFGYTEEEAASFEGTARLNDAGIGSVSVAPKDHPDWTYTFVWQDNPRAPGMTSPMMGQTPTERERALRLMLRKASEEKWFSDWDDTGRAAAAVYFQSIRQELTVLLEADGEKAFLTPAQAVDALFTAWCGTKAIWSPALWQWRNEVLKENGLTAYRQKENLLTYSKDDTFRPFTVYQFQGLVPYEFSAALSHPRLEGWKLLSGAVLDCTDGSTSAGLAAFGRGEERMLVSLVRPLGEAEWQLSPIGSQALIPGKEAIITSDAVTGSFLIEIPLTERESVYLDVTVGIGKKGICSLDAYSRMDWQSGAGVTIRGYSASVYRPGEPVEQLALSKEKGDLGYLDFTDVSLLPGALTDPNGDSVLPGLNYVLCTGAHLRVQTSSRSGDLGEIAPGVLCQLIEIVPGDPDPWAHVRIGLLEGYICGRYIYGGGLNSSVFPGPLTVAQTQKETALKKGTGLLDGKVTDLPAGTQMHVLTQRGNWLYVAMPQGRPGPYMDVDSVYGFVRESDVIQAATALQLDWME